MNSNQRVFIDEKSHLITYLRNSYNFFTISSSVSPKYNKQIIWRSLYFR